jgi:hypothetical protein
MVGMAGRYTGSYLEQLNGWRAVAILAEIGQASLVERIPGSHLGFDDESDKRRLGERFRFEVEPDIVFEYLPVARKPNPLEAEIAQGWMIVWTGAQGQWHLRSFAAIGRSLMLAIRRCIRPSTLNSQVSLP